MFRCRQPLNHYLIQCWPRFMSPYGITIPQCVNLIRNDYSFHRKNTRCVGGTIHFLFNLALMQCMRKSDALIYVTNKRYTDHLSTFNYSINKCYIYKTDIHVSKHNHIYAFWRSARIINIVSRVNWTIRVARAFQHKWFPIGRHQRLYSTLNSWIL